MNFSLDIDLFTKTCLKKKKPLQLYHSLPVWALFPAHTGKKSNAREKEKETILKLHCKVSYSLTIRQNKPKCNVCIIVLDSEQYCIFFFHLLS